ncbi:hypothetical protein [uncultured Bilophila sp.]|uniref:hypothetical protein n=1 Tax=uncultured Bilophila sp. TaxID=529385 RepID=UPI0025E38404|nr:hypothetical protein [uncultured Bilophila sp.]
MAKVTFSKAGLEALGRKYAEAVLRDASLPPEAMPLLAESEEWAKASDTLRKAVCDAIRDNARRELRHAGFPVEKINQVIKRG